MITKTSLFAKTFYSYSMRNLRQKKSLRDHETGRKPAYHPQDTGCPNGHAGEQASRRAGGQAGAVARQHPDADHRRNETRTGNRSTTGNENTEEAAPQRETPAYPAPAGVYLVTLTVVDDLGDETSSVQPINVRPAP